MNRDETVQELVEAATAGNQSTLGGLLDDVRSAYCRYIGFATQAQSVALTLWTAHTHAIEAADCTPYIRIYSAEKESGKTRTEEVAFHLVRNGVRASNALHPHPERHKVQMLS
jgi:hypothetical protein